LRRGRERVTRSGGRANAREPEQGIRHAEQVGVCAPDLDSSAVEQSRRAWSVAPRPQSIGLSCRKRRYSNV